MLARLRRFGNGHEARFVRNSSIRPAGPSNLFQALLVLQLSPAIGDVVRRAWSTCVASFARVTDSLTATGPTQGIEQAAAIVCKRVDDHAKPLRTNRVDHNESAGEADSAVLKTLR